MVFCYPGLRPHGWAENMKDIRTRLAACVTMSDAKPGCIESSIESRAAVTAA